MHNEYLFVQNNIPHNKRTVTYFSIVTLKFRAFVTTYQPSAQNYGLCKWNLWEFFCLSTSFWRLWSPHASSEGQKDEKSLPPKTPHSATGGSIVAAVWVGVSQASAIQPSLCASW